MRKGFQGEGTMPELLVKSMTPEGLCDIIRQVSSQLTCIRIELNQQCTGGGPIVDGKRVRTYQTVEYVWKGSFALDDVEKKIHEKSHTIKLITLECEEGKSILLTNWEVSIYGFREFPLIMSMISGPYPTIQFKPR